ncbi:uncharacterized protein BP5553_04389 [Venustampulla echinocandica]|uniref:Phosphatidic acid phosphatase type 2/haloperoxidase domain-containing protein n=1 Tax=Venustampulla echinocandica TaxID=2656787 RepID=A0A370TN54_9HELO|nr:uncharacterized protein BP5553_04389 [Venustampulla echinocandica]RDL36956.1 hypothetical protein BP5553_04389 [Venustampulla echinocandica]
MQQLSRHSLILTSFITNVVKNAVGRPRPDLISRCKPAATAASDVLVDISVCTQTNHHVLHDGWRSFPSGHSSFAFAGLGFLTLFFCGQMHVLRPRTDLGRALLAIAPLLGAALIAISRCEDYRCASPTLEERCLNGISSANTLISHDVYDVTCGSILGISIAYFSYRRYFPRLRSRKCDEPFASREAIFNEGFAKIKNDEETGRATRIFDLSDVDDEDAN